jgi:hypothetical protein
VIVFGRFFALKTAYIKFNYIGHRALFGLAQFWAILGQNLGDFGPIYLAKIWAFFHAKSGHTERDAHVDARDGNK